MIFHGRHSNAYNYIAERYEFRFNEVTNFYEFRKKFSKRNTWIKFDDRYRNTILLDLSLNSIEVPKDKVDIFIESEQFSKIYNPFSDYFERLNPWNEKRDYIGRLADTVKTDNDEKFREILKKFLIGCIDCLLVPDNYTDVCLVFQSSQQGVGKTRWMRKLLPKEFRDEYFYEGNVDTKNKDHVRYLSQYWFIHLDELEALRGNDISSIKSYITRQRISLRKAFGRYDSHLVRRANFLGSVNDDKFLSDTTGNRRWLVFKTLNINYEHTININKVWAQAYHLWKQKERHWFDIEEIKEINKQNEKFRTVSLEEELLLRHFSFSSVKDKNSMFLSSSEVIEKIVAKVPSSFANNIRTVQMGKALSKYTYFKEMKGGIQRYYVEHIEYGGEIEEGDDLPF